MNKKQAKSVVLKGEQHGSLREEFLIVMNKKQAKSVVLKGEQHGSLREEFLIPGRKLVPGRNWRGKGVNEKA